MQYELFEASDGAESEFIAWDDVHNVPLEPQRVIDARKEEMGYVYHHGVYTYSTIAECLKTTGAQPVDTRWLDTNKGDTKNPLYRSRWVAKQFKRSWIEAA